jgi:hypothetical protein
MRPAAQAVGENGEALTARQREILPLLAEGLPNKADRRCVRHHRRHREAASQEIVQVPEREG